MSQELPRSDSMSFEQLCRAAAHQLVEAFDQSYELDDEDKAKVEEALTQALIARPASLDAIVGTNVLPEGLIAQWDAEAEGYDVG